MSSRREADRQSVHPGWLKSPSIKTVNTALQTPTQGEVYKATAESETLLEDPLVLSIKDISSKKRRKARVEFEGASIGVTGVNVNILQTLSGRTPMPELNARFGAYTDAPSLPSIPAFRAQVRRLNDSHLWRIGIYISSDSIEINGREIKMLSLKRGLLPAATSARLFPKGR